MRTQKRNSGLGGSRAQSPGVWFRLAGKRKGILDRSWGHAAWQAKVTAIHKYQENLSSVYGLLGKLRAARSQTSQSSFCSPATARGLLVVSALHYGGRKVSQMQGLSRGEEETETSVLPSMSIYFRRVRPKYIEPGNSRAVTFQSPRGIHLQKNIPGTGNS